MKNTLLKVAIFIVAVAGFYMAFVTFSEVTFARGGRRGGGGGSGSGILLLLFILAVFIFGVLWIWWGIRWVFEKVSDWIYRLIHPPLSPEERRKQLDERKKQFEERMEARKKYYEERKELLFKKPGWSFEPGCNIPINKRFSEANWELEMIHILDKKRPTKKKSESTQLELDLGYQSTIEQIVHKAKEQCSDWKKAVEQVLYEYDKVLEFEVVEILDSNDLMVTIHKYKGSSGYAKL